MKTIRVKAELEGLRYDINQGLTKFQNPEDLLKMAMTKIGFILNSDKKGYEVSWK